MSSPPSTSQSQSRDLFRIFRGLAILVAIYLAFVFLVPKPEAVKPEGWRLAGIFLATVAGLMLEPIAGGALVLLSITLAAVYGGLGVEKALQAPWLLRGSRPEKCDFRFAHEIQGLYPSLSGARPCAAGSSELVRSFAKMLRARNAGENHGACGPRSIKSVMDLPEFPKISRNRQCQR